MPGHGFQSLAIKNWLDGHQTLGGSGVALTSGFKPGRQLSRKVNDWCPLASVSCFGNRSIASLPSAMNRRWCFPTRVRCLLSEFSQKYRSITVLRQNDSSPSAISSGLYYPSLSVSRPSSDIRLFATLDKY